MILDNPDNVVVFEAGKRVGFCSRCGVFFEGDPDTCAGCGGTFVVPDAESEGTLTITKVELVPGEYTVGTGKLGPKNEADGMANRAQRRALRRRK